MLKILSGSKETIKANLKLLANDYQEKTGRKVCLTCPSDIAYMILSLKHFYKMRNFEFSRQSAQYKNKKGDKTTISNGTMTDESAIEFLRTNPERIKLFSKYPEGWKELLKKGKMTDEQVEERLAAQAEIEAAKEAKEALKVVNKKEDSEDVSEEDLKNIEVNEPETVSPEEEAMKASEKAAEDAANAAINEAERSSGNSNEEGLMNMKLSELRELYPEVKATSVKSFVSKVLNQ